MRRLPLPAHPLQRCLLLVLLLALLAGPMLAHLHAVVHAGGHGEHSAQHDHDAHAGDDMHHDGHAHPHHGNDGYDAPSLRALFAGHGEPLDCRLFDQACGGDATAPVALLVLPALPPAHLLRIFQGLAKARWASAFDARGPPASV